MSQHLKSAAGLLATILACTVAPGQAGAQPLSYPERVVRIVIPYPAGGNVDFAARLIANKLGQRFGQPFIVENKPGASSAIGTDAVTKAAPDGHTLLITLSSALARLSTEQSIDPMTNLSPVFGISYTQLALAVNAAGVPSKSFDEFVTFAKGRPLFYGSLGNNTTPHLYAHAVGSQAKLDFTHVPYKGEAPMILELMAGQVQMGFVTIGSSRIHVRDGKLRLLAVVGDKRSEFAPDVPTLEEVGIRGFKLTSSIAIYAPRRTPKDILSKLEQAGRQIVAMPDVQELLRAQMNTPWPATPADLGTSLIEQQAEMQTLLRAVNTR